MSYRIKVDGVRQLRNSARRAGADLADLKAANAAAAAMVAAAAAQKAPRRSGALASTLRGNRAIGRAVVQAGRARVPYAGPIHWGWPAREITANPFVTDAATATEATWQPLYAAEVARVLSTVHGI